MRLCIKCRRYRPSQSFDAQGRYCSSRTCADCRAAAEPGGEPPAAERPGEMDLGIEAAQAAHEARWAALKAEFERRLELVKAARIAKGGPGIPLTSADLSRVLPYGRIRCGQ